MGPVTTNPFVIAAINMTIVFGVLAIIGLMMHIIEMVDPTKKKSVPVAAPKAAAPAAVAAAPVVEDKSEEIAAVIAAAVAAAGLTSDQVACVRINRAIAWEMNAHAEAISVRKECF